MQISKDLLIQSKICSPQLADQWVDALNKTCEKYEINTPLRIAGFLSQCAHESGGFKFTVENLNYSVDSLLRVFPKYFNAPMATEYARQPERIANRVYANRMGNGDESSGDGWKYRGRGLIQLTGKDNYSSFAMSADNESLIKPELVEQPELAAMSAGWFFNAHDLNSFADAKDIVGMTKRINGGINGLDDRQMKYAKLIEILS